MNFSDFILFLFNLPTCKRVVGLCTKKMTLYQKSLVPFVMTFENLCG
jgi:hypothetical protein